MAVIEKKEKTEKKNVKKQAPRSGPEKEVKKEVPRSTDPNFRHLVRISGVVLDGNQTILKGLTKIKGIGMQISGSLDNVLGISHERKIGTLTEEEVSNIETIIENLDKHFPAWMLNHRGDYLTGRNLHLLGSDLDVAKRDDITREQKMRSYRGIRHTMGLPVRGQRTRTSFRTGATLGVTRKKEAAAAAPPKKEEKSKKGEKK